MVTAICFSGWLLLLFDTGYLQCDAILLFLCALKYWQTTSVCTARVYCTYSLSVRFTDSAVLWHLNYKLGVTVHGYLQYKAPVYLVDCCTPVSDISSRRHLQSATRHHLTVPRYRLSTFSRRAFSVTGPTVWNSLPNSLRDLSTLRIVYVSEPYNTTDCTREVYILSLVERLSLCWRQTLTW